MSESMITITELRNHFDEYLERVKLDVVFVITAYGKPFAWFTPSKKVQGKQKTRASEKPKGVKTR